MLERLLPLLAALPATADAGELELLDVLGAGDPLALAVAPDGRSAHVLEGTRLVELELPSGRERRVLELDATVLELVREGPRLWAAAGDRGLLRIDLEDDRPVPVAQTSRPGRWCTAVHVEPAGEERVAAFCSAAGSELVHAGPRGERVLPLPPGAPVLALLLAGDEVWLARGRDGLQRVDLTSGVVRAGPDLSQLPVPPGLPPGFVCDLARSGDTLLVAASLAGLVRIDLAAPRVAPRALPLTRGDLPLAAMALAADGDEVVVGALPAPAEVAHGAPYHPLGRIGMDLEVGAVPRERYRVGRDALLLRFRMRDGLPVRSGGEVLGPVGFRSLHLGPRHVHALLTGAGLELRSRQDLARRVLARRPEGLPALGSFPSLQDGNRLWVGADSQGSRVRGLARVGESGLEIEPGLEGRLGLVLAPPWLDDEDREWLLAGTGTGWRLWHRDRAGAELHGVDLVPPADAAGGRGASYFTGLRVGRLLVLTRAGSPEALLAVDGPDLERAALALRGAGNDDHGPRRLEPQPAWTFALPPGEEPLAHAWRPASFEGPDGTTHLLVPAGRDGQHRARSLVLALPPGGPPVVVARLGGAGRDSHAVAAATLRREGRWLGLVGELDGRWSLFDLSRPEEPRLLAGGRTSPDVLDGRSSPVLDVALAEGARGGLRAYLAAGRGGLLVLDPLSGVLERHSTPGWAAGLGLRPGPGGTEVLLGDQRAGLRRYAPAEARGEGRRIRR